ncbi:MAG: amidase, partial [Pirellulaceae bacterium]
MNPQHRDVQTKPDPGIPTPPGSPTVAGNQSRSPSIDRRKLLQVLATGGIGSACFHRALVAQATQARQVTTAMVQQAAWIADLELSEDELSSTTARVERTLDKFQTLRNQAVGYDTPPAIYFSAAPGEPSGTAPIDRHVKSIGTPKPVRPENDQELAFLPVTDLAALLKARKISSLQLTQIYLDRLKRYDPLLHCVVTLTEELALKQARQADREIASGKYRGPLHGIPWGAKDLIAYPGYPTSWGAPHFREQLLDTKATVAQRLEDAGAVLVAKLSLGALAMGDRWFGGMTRNPWKTSEGSSGSSAGSASATAAGLVGFTLGSETLGSIVSPCRRCGATGLRPTFGRVSRHGCMTLAWSMDKIGPITRSVE